MLTQPEIWHGWATNELKKRAHLQEQEAHEIALAWLCEQAQAEPRMHLDVDLLYYLWSKVLHDMGNVNAAQDLVQSHYASPILKNTILASLSGTGLAPRTRWEFIRRGILTKRRALFANNAPWWIINLTPLQQDPLFQLELQAWELGKKIYHFLSAVQTPETIFHIRPIHPLPQLKPIIEWVRTLP